MLRAEILDLDARLTKSGHWARPFDIIDRATGAFVEVHEPTSPFLSPVSPLVIFVCKDGQVVQNPVVDVLLRHGWGHQGIIEPEPRIAPRSIGTEAGSVEAHAARDASAIGRVETPQAALQWMKAATGLSDGEIANLLGVSRPTLDAWRRGGKISTRRLRRLYAVHDVLRRAASRLSSPEELRVWLVTPRGADGRTPEDLLRSNEIDRARLLAMSSPSSRLVRPPAWVRQPVPDAWRAGAEARQEPELPEDEQDIPAVPRRRSSRRVAIRRRG